MTILHTLRVLHPSQSVMRDAWLAHGLWIMGRAAILVSHFVRGGAAWEPAIHHPFEAGGPQYAVRCAALRRGPGASSISEAAAAAAGPEGRGQGGTTSHQQAAPTARVQAQAQLAAGRGSSTRQLSSGLRAPRVVPPEEARSEKRTAHSAQQVVCEMRKLAHPVVFSTDCRLWTASCC
jgi:hypothetical protein